MQKNVVHNKNKTKLYKTMDLYNLNKSNGAHLIILTGKSGQGKSFYHRYNLTSKTFFKQFHRHIMINPSYEFDKVLHDIYMDKKDLYTSISITIEDIWKIIREIEEWKKLNPSKKCLLTFDDVGGLISSVKNVMDPVRNPFLYLGMKGRKFCTTIILVQSITQIGTFLRENTRRIILSKTNNIIELKHLYNSFNMGLTFSDFQQKLKEIFSQGNQYTKLFINLDTDEGFLTEIKNNKVIYKKIY